MTDTIETTATAFEAPAAESGAVLFVPLSKLKKSPRNARKTPHSEAHIEALAASIAAKGMLQNLVVKPEANAEGEPTGYYFVTIGEGRRLAQVLRVKRKQIRKTEAIRCVLDTVNDATEISLDENVTREAMHPADQFERFRELADNRGWGAEEIAARFGVSAHVVRQRLRLGAVSPKLMQVYRDGGLSLDQLMAFAITEDHARQEQAYENLSWNREPSMSANTSLANFKGTGLKGQLAASSKRAAILLKKLFDEFGVVTTEVVISAPEMRESEDEVDEADDDLVRTFWRKMMERYGGEDAYNRTIVEQFKGPADPDIIIVVDKLLTGFDAPRNTVLYVARRLKEHGLLQAIARVNRVFDEDGAPDKPFGFIIDYTGVLKDLGDALASYDALQGFSPEDIASSVLAIRDEANKVPGAHAALLDVFKSVSNSFDAEAYARLLADEEIRAEFYVRLSAFSRAFSVALASPAFIEATKPELLKRWKDDLGRFVSLRAAVSLRYAERVDWRDYEKRIRQLLDRHVIARDVLTLVEPLNIFDDIAIEGRRQEKTESDASVADTIAHQLTRSIEEKWDEDPIFFEKFSKLVRDTIADFHKGRITDLTYLSKVRELRDKVQTRQDETDPTPARLRDDGHAQAFGGLAKRNLERVGVDDVELAADIALEISRIVQKRRKVGWQYDRDVENVIRNDIDDFFFEELRGQRDMLIDPAILDGIVDDVLASARVRLAQ